MKTMKKMFACFGMTFLLLLLFAGITVQAETTYGYLSKSVSYNTKNCDVRYHAVEPTKFTITAVVSGKEPVTKIRIYNYTVNAYKDFDASSKYWTYNAEKNVSAFSCSMTINGTGDLRFQVAQDAPANGRTIALNVKASIEKQPTNVKAAAMTTSVINVTWDAIPGVTGYQVYRSTSKTGTYTKLGTVTTNACKVTGLKTGTAYYYKVRGYYKSGNEVLYSKYSAVAGAKTLSKAVYANKLAELKAGTSYKSYDFTADGKANTFKYVVEAGKAKIYLDGKYKQSIDLLRGGWLYYCGVDKANTYLIAICGQYHGQTFVVYRYSGGKFKQVTAAADYADCMLSYSTPVSISNNILTINTTPCTLDSDKVGNGGAFKSFSDVKMKGKDSMGYKVQFKLDNGKMTLYNKLFVATGRVGYYAKNSFKTSASYTKMTANDGPIVQAGTRVVVKKIIIAGKTPWEGKNYFQIDVNGKLGWFMDSQNIILKLTK